MSVPAIDPNAPPLPPPVVFNQLWLNLTFIHWPVDPSTVAHFFPAGSRPDVVDGVTYVGLIPFELRKASFGRRGAVPYFGSFRETNIRLYSVDDHGRHGVVFRSLDTERLAILPLARLVFGVPYTWARMRTAREGDEMRYESIRRWPERGLRTSVRVRIGEPVQPTPLEVFLTARWGLHARVAGRTIWVPNEHPPWALHAATVVELRDDLLAASGVRAAGEPLRVLWSPGVRARFGRPSLLR